MVPGIGIVFCVTIIKGIFHSREGFGKDAGMDGMVDWMVNTSI